MERESDYWENVVATHYPTRRPFSRLANLYTFALVATYVLVQRQYGGFVGVFYWTMLVSAVVVAIAHKETSGQKILNIEGARLVDSLPQLFVGLCAFMAIYFGPQLLGRAPRVPDVDTVILFLIASLGESVWFGYVMPQVIPYALFTAPFIFAVSHDVFFRAYTTGTLTPGIITFAVTAFGFGLAMILILGSRTWLRGVSRWQLWKGGGLWVIVLVHLAVNLSIYSYSYLYGVIM